MSYESPHVTVVPTLHGRNIAEGLRLNTFNKSPVDCGSWESCLEIGAVKWKLGMS